MKLKIAIALLLVGMLLAFAMLYTGADSKVTPCVDGSWIVGVPCRD